MAACFHADRPESKELPHEETQSDVNPVKPLTLCFSLLCVRSLIAGAPSLGILDYR